MTNLDDLHEPHVTSWTSVPDDGRTDPDTVLDDLPARADALAREHRALDDVLTPRYRWRIGVGTAHALHVRQQIRMHPSGHIPTDAVPTPQELLDGQSTLLGLPADVVDDLPFGHLELHEVER